MFVSNLCFLKWLLFRFFLLTCPAHTVSLWACTHTLQANFLSVSKCSASCFITVFLYCALKIDGRKISGGFWRESAYMFFWMSYMAVNHLHRLITKINWIKPFNLTEGKSFPESELTKISRKIKKNINCFKIWSSYINWLIVFEK